MEETLDVELSKKLKTGIVTFEYRKNNGEIRCAVGTHLIDLMPVEKQPKNTNAVHETQNNINYYDFLVKDWRSLKKESVIKVTAAVNSI
jgi:hypothetical protein